MTASSTEHARTVQRASCLPRAYAGAAARARRPRKLTMYLVDCCFECTLDSTARCSPRHTGQPTTRNEAPARSRVLCRAARGGTTAWPTACPMQAPTHRTHSQRPARSCVRVARHAGVRVYGRWLVARDAHAVAHALQQLAALRGEAVKRLRVDPRHAARRHLLVAHAVEHLHTRPDAVGSGQQ
jgi:hypothetical protein